MLNSPCVATPDVGTAGLGRTPPRAARAAGRAPGACVVCGVYGGGPPCPDSVPPPGRCRTTALCRRRWQETAQEGSGKSPKDVGTLWGGFSLGCYQVPAACGFSPWVASFPWAAPCFLRVSPVGGGFPPWRPPSSRTNFRNFPSTILNDQMEFAAREWHGEIPWDISERRTARSGRGLSLNQAHFFGGSESQGVQVP